MTDQSVYGIDGPRGSNCFNPSIAHQRNRRSEAYLSLLHMPRGRYVDDRADHG